MRRLRSFEWPEAEGDQLAALWPGDEQTDYSFELEPLRQEDARLAAEKQGHDGSKFLEAVHLADVASLASRPITLFFLLKEFVGDEFETTSRRQLYKNGCRRLCEEQNSERARLSRQLSKSESSIDEKIVAAGRIACGLLLGGRQSICCLTSYDSIESSGNVCRADELTGCGLLRESVVEQVLGTGLFTAAGRERFAFAHQTFAECVASQTLSELPLAQLRTFLCATDPASGAEYVIPQLVELSAWVAGEHAEYFAHLIDVDPAALLRSGVAFADAAQKAKLVERILELAGKNQFFDKSGYWRFWRDLDYPDLPAQLKHALEDSCQHRMVQRVAIGIAEACRRTEMITPLFGILNSHSGDRYFRGSVAEALCACMPDDRLVELEPLVRGEVGPDPDQSILGHALQRLVPTHWSVADALPYIGRTRDPNLYGSYWRSLEELPKYIVNEDILPGLRAIREWNGGFSSTSFRRKLCMALFSRGLENIDDPEICAEFVKLWTTKTRSFRDFFRKGDREDADFIIITDESRRKWIAAIINSTPSNSDDRIDFLSFDTYRLLNPDDFPWLLENLLGAEDVAAPAWAKAVYNMIWDEQIRLTWWDDFINAYRCSSALQDRMSWFEDTSLDSPARRSAKAQWLWRERRYEMARKRRLDRENRLDPKSEIERAFSEISAGESWEFINLCWALTLNDKGHYSAHLHHDITEYSGWSTISEEQKEFVRDAAHKFLLERSDGWYECGGRTNFSAPGVVAIWLLRDVIESNESLRLAVASKWIDAILGIWDPSSDYAKDLFALAYKINPKLTANGWIREIRRDSEHHGHPFTIRRAATCFNRTLGKELIELIKTLTDPKSVRLAIYELKELDNHLAGEVANYLLWREIHKRRFCDKMIEALVIAGIGTGARSIWRLVFPVLDSSPALAKRVILSVAVDADMRDKYLCEELAEDELGDLYLMLCRLFPHSGDPDEKSGKVTPRRALVHFRSAVLNALSGKNTLAACDQLRRIATALPDQSTWVLYRYQQTLGALRRNEWLPCGLPDIAIVLANDYKRIIRDNGDLMNLILDALKSLQINLGETTLPAVEDLWHWEGAGLNRRNFRHKDEEAVSDYIARWLRDRIGSQSKVVVNREVQPVRGKRTDILVQAWSLSNKGRSRQEVPLSVTIEVKGCWNCQIKTGAKDQLLDGYLRPFGLTHGIFLVAWFHSPDFAKIASGQKSELPKATRSEAALALSDFVHSAQATGFEIKPFILDCSLS